MSHPPLTYLLGKVADGKFSKLLVNPSDSWSHTPKIYTFLFSSISLIVLSMVLVRISMPVWMLS